MSDVTTPDIPRLLHESGTTVAVVGATDDPSKYGGRIYRDLKQKGFTVFAVNPSRTEVDGDQCWPTLADLPDRPTIVDYVVPPAVTLAVLEEALALDLMNAWVQPGAEDAAVIEYLETHEFNHLVNACIMVHSRSNA
jgi:predicted CoA-binding protein